MTNEERRLALYCLKANSNLHGEICEKCSQYPECDHFIQDNVMEELIEALEQEPCEDKIIEWKKDFKEYINSLSMPRDDYKGIMEYINDVPSVQPKQICEDTISRQMVLEYIEGSEAELGHSSENELVCRDIKEFPPVTPQEPETGHWIKYEDKHYYCSCCKEWAIRKYVPAKQTIVDVLSKYCPNCGARMVEPQESEDKG